MKSHNFDLRRKPVDDEPVATPQNQVSVPQQQPNVWKQEVLPRLGILAFMGGASLLGALNNIMKKS